MNHEKIERVIELNEDLLENNVKIAALNSEFLANNNIKAFDIVGAIGAGKTLILEKIVKKLSGKYKIMVINGDVTTRIDADRIQKQGAKCIQINTGRECALNAYHIHQILEKLDVKGYDLLFIENVGNLICPSDFILGTNMTRIVIVSVTEGEHVIRKHPLLFKMSQIAIINKIDLLPYLDNVNIERMINDAKKINPDIKIITTSAKNDENIDTIIQSLGID
ncbi:MAG: hydrogenase nickel incorporation protein HypB [Promethearchaeota archaeon]